MRLVFVATTPDACGLAAWAFPLAFLDTTTSFKQPIFGCNNLAGGVWPAGDGGGPGGRLPAHKFKLEFRQARVNEGEKRGWEVGCERACAAAASGRARVTRPLLRARVRAHHRLATAHPGRGRHVPAPVFPPAGVRAGRAEAAGGRGRGQLAAPTAASQPADPHLPPAAAAAGALPRPRRATTSC